jgi:hypothetical protein
VRGQLSGRALEGAHLGGGGNHGGRTARAAWHGAREGGRCLNRPTRVGHDVGGEDAAVVRRSLAYARTGRTANGPAVRRVHGARTTRRQGGAWRAGFKESRGARTWVRGAASVGT